MQFLGLDAQLPELTARTARAARFDRTQYAGLEHACSGRSIRESQGRAGVHVFHTVAQSMIRSGAPAMVTEVFTPGISLHRSATGDWFEPGLQLEEWFRGDMGHRFVPEALQPRQPVHNTRTDKRASA